MPNLRNFPVGTYQLMAHILVSCIWVLGYIMSKLFSCVYVSKTLNLKGRKRWKFKAICILNVIS